MPIDDDAGQTAPADLRTRHVSKRRRVLIWVSVGLCTILLSIGAVVGVTALVNSAGPFATPIEWTNDGPAATSIRLQSGGTADLVNFPRGTNSTERIDGKTYNCLERSITDELYTGPATWKTEGDWAFTLTFGSSTGLVRSGKSGYFLPEPDWQIARFDECGDGGEGWGLSQHD